MPNRTFSTLVVTGENGIVKVDLQNNYFKLLKYCDNTLLF